MNNIDGEAPGNEGETLEGQTPPQEPPTQRRRFHLGTVVLIAGLVLLIVIFARQPPPSATAIGNLPHFNLVKINGGALKSDDLKGKVIVVDFWASWCEPCKSEIPKYNKLVASMTGKDFQLIGYAVESGSLDEVRKSAGELGILYQVVMGTDEVTQAFGNYRGLPTTFLIGRDGKIYKKYEGTSATKVADVAKDITQLLAIPYTPAEPSAKPIAQLSR